MQKLVFLDVETTGFKNNKIVQLAYNYDGRTIVTYLNPECPIEIEAMAVHHITEKMVQDQPKFWESVFVERLRTLLSAGYTPVAHNAKFDVGVLAGYGMKIPKYICTMKMFQYLNSIGKYDLQAFNLQYLRYALGLELGEGILPHSAQGDVEVLVHLFHKISEHITDIDEMVKICNKPVELKRLPFGKYKGKTFEEVKKLDKKYLEWLRGSLQKEENEDLFYTVSLYLGYLQ